MRPVKKVLAFIVCGLAVGLLFAADPPFFGGGYTPNPNDTKWMVLQRILGLLDANAAANVNPTFLGGHTPNRNDPEPIILQKILGALIDGGGGGGGGGGSGNGDGVWTNSSGIVRLVEDTPIEVMIHNTTNMNFRTGVTNANGSESWFETNAEIDAQNTAVYVYNSVTGEQSEFQMTQSSTDLNAIYKRNQEVMIGISPYGNNNALLYLNSKTNAFDPLLVQTNDITVLLVDKVGNTFVGGKLEVKTNITFNGTTPVIISGGATYGNDRGSGSLDVQSSHLSSEVASGANAIAVGRRNTASGATAVSVGSLNNVSASSGVGVGSANTVSTGAGAMAFGVGNTATGVNSLALGQSATASAASSGAAGTGATSDAQFTWNITGPIMNWKSEVAKGGNNSGASGDYKFYSGVEVVLMGQEVDLETTQDYTVNIASGLHFYPDETGVIVTSANTVSGQPSFSFGISGNTTKLLGATAATGLTAAFKRQRFATLLTSEGEVTVTGSVTTGATATTLLGRFYWKGLLVRDQ